MPPLPMPTSTAASTAKLQNNAPSITALLILHLL
jgi:hypothetical protein